MICKVHFWWLKENFQHIKSLKKLHVEGVGHDAREKKNGHPHKKKLIKWWYIMGSKCYTSCNSIKKRLPDQYLSNSS